MKLPLFYSAGTPLSSVDGMTFGVKDNLCTKDLHTSCSSEFLRGMYDV